MAHMGGSASEEIDAPLEEVWAVVADVLDAPDWQGGLVGMTALEHDGEGRADARRDRERHQGPHRQDAGALQLRPAGAAVVDAGEGRPEVGRGLLGPRGPRRRPDARRPTSSTATRAACSGCSSAGPSSRPCAGCSSTRARASSSSASRAADAGGPRARRRRPRVGRVPEPDVADARQAGPGISGKKVMLAVRVPSRST